MESIIQFIHVLLAFALQIIDLFIQLVVSILQFFLVLARMALTALHLL